MVLRQNVPFGGGLAVMVLTRARASAGRAHGRAGGHGPWVGGVNIGGRRVWGETQGGVDGCEVRVCLEGFELRLSGALVYIGMRRDRRRGRHPAPWASHNDGGA